MTRRAALLAVILTLFLAAVSARADSPERVSQNETRAETVEELRVKIEERGSAVAQLENQIAAYQEELEKVGKEAKTLQSAIRALELERKKLTAGIRVTEERVKSATLAIAELSGGIAEKERKIAVNLEALRDALRTVEKLERTTLVEAMLAEATLSAFWDEIDALERFEKTLSVNLEALRALKAGLEEEKGATEAKRRELAALRARLTDQRQILDGRRREQQTLLSTTRNKESEYRKLLAERVRLRDAFAQELLLFESELRIAIDPARLPQTGSGVLRWPLDSVKITQYFGDTAFARSGGYSGRGHNGIDLRAPIGTTVRAAASGTVSGVGDTDAVCRGASYGKWVLVEHQNGLSTLYAHFSLVKVTEGQAVNTGEIIGYSGDSGYATGPHLHFTVYATQGVRVMARKSAVCRGTYAMPIADLKAYLNPLSYL